MQRSPTNDRRIEYLPLAKLKPAKRNPKRHDEKAIEGSIERFGYAEPILLDERTGRLVAGHGRLSALRRAKDGGSKTPSGVRDAGEDWLVPVVRGWSSKTDAEAEAYLVAANKLAEAGGWNDEELSALLRRVAKETEVAGLGFTSEELNALMHEAAKATEDALRHSVEDTGRTPDDAKIDYETTSLRQIVLIFDEKEFEKIVDQFAKVREAEELEDNTSVVRLLLERHEPNTRRAKKKA